MRASLQRPACVLALAAMPALTGCRPDAAVHAVVTIDGSSTVAPLTEAVAEDFQHARPRRQ